MKNLIYTKALLLSILMIVCLSVTLHSLYLNNINARFDTNGNQKCEIFQTSNLVAGKC